MKSRKVTGLVCRVVNEVAEISIVNEYSRNLIPATPHQINSCHSNSDVEEGLLLGTSCIQAIKPREVIRGSDDDPYAIRTDLG